MKRTLILLASSLLVAIASAAESGGPDPSQIAPVAPTGAGGKAASSGGFDPSMILIMGLLVAFLWLMVIRPQKKEEKKRQELVSSIKPGHKVITIGGAHGEVITVGEATVEVRIGEEGKGLVVTFNKGAIATNVTTTPVTAK